MSVPMQKNTLIEELKHLVSFKPVTSHKDGTTALLRYVESELQKVGLKTAFSTSHGYPSLVAGTLSTERSKLLLQAHIDVVPADEDLFTVRQKAAVLYGRGVCDMLFATAIYLCMLRDLHAEGLLAGMDVGLMLTGDEEIGGYDGVGRLFESYECDICVLPDAGGPDTINIKAKGVLQLQVTLQGVAGHAGRPADYDNPIVKASAFVQDIVSRFPNNTVDKTVCSIGMINAGKAANQVPSTATVTLDLRYAAEDDPHELVKTVQSIGRKHAGTVETLCLDPGYEIDIQEPSIQRFLDLYESRTGLQVRPIAVPGSSDARFIVPKGIPVIMMRPEAGGMHAETESLNIASLVSFAEILKEYALAEAKV